MSDFMCAAESCPRWARDGSNWCAVHAPPPEPNPRDAELARLRAERDEYRGRSRKLRAALLELIRFATVRLLGGAELSGAREETKLAVQAANKALAEAER